MILNILVLRSFDTAVREMHGTAEIFDENRVDPQNRFACVPALHYVAHRQCAFIARLFEIRWSQNLGANFVKDFSWIFPFWKQRRRLSGIRTLDVLVFVVFRAPLNDSVIDYSLDGLQNFALRSFNFR